MILVETERLTLRSFEHSDVDEYFAIVSDVSIRKYVPYATAFSRKTACILVNDYCLGDFKNDFYIIFKDKQTMEIVGAIIAVKISSSALDVSYLVNANLRNKGFMKEALMGFINYLINSPFMYSYLQFTIENENIASQEVVKACGGKPFRRLSKSWVWRIKIDHFDLL